MTRRNFIFGFPTTIIATALVACGKNQKTKTDNINYEDIILSIRDANTNDTFPVYFRNEDEKLSIDTSHIKDMDEATIEAEISNTILPRINLTLKDCKKFAISVATPETQSYCIAIVKPAENRTGAELIYNMMEYIETQKSNMKNCLPDQYTIANKAIVKQLDSGEVILACCEDAVNTVTAITELL